MQRLDRCAICRVKGVCRQVTLTVTGNQVNVCDDMPSCMLNLVNLLGAHQYNALTEHLVEMMLYNNTRVGICAECHTLVHTSQSRVELHEGITTVHVHYPCFMERLSQKLQGALTT